MIIRRFLQWTATAPADARAEGAAALARAYVDGEFDAIEQRDAEAVLTALLDDVAPCVRLALARELAVSPLTPPAIATALAADNAEIASLILEHSPVLGTPELVDAAAAGGTAVQSAIARRRTIPVGLAAALAEVGSLPACVILCLNPGAELPERSLARMLGRFGHDGALREAIGCRPDLPPGLRYDLVVDTARHLESFVTACGWLSADRAARTTREAADQACLTIGADALDDDGMSGVAALASHLRRTGCLTPALILRAALCGSMSLVEAAFSELSGVPVQRVAGFLRTGPGLGFDSLYGKAGLPPALRGAFTAALQPARSRVGAADAAAPRRERIGRALEACASPRHGDLGTVMALLRRLDAEAAREQARSFARTVMEDGHVLRLPRPSERDRVLPLSSAA